MCFIKISIFSWMSFCFSTLYKEDIKYVGKTVII